MFFGFRMVSNTTFVNTGYGFKTSRGNPKIFTVLQVKMTGCLFNKCSITLATSMYISLNNKEGSREFSMKKLPIVGP